MKRLTGFSRFGSALVLVGLVAAACAGGRAASLGPGPTAGTTSPTAPATSPAPGHSPGPSPSPVRLYTFQVWLTKGGKLFETTRTEPFDVAVAKLALTALAKGPDHSESAVGIGTGIPNRTTFVITSVSSGVAGVQPAPQNGLTALARAQVVFTLTQYANIKSVRFAGSPTAYGRASFGSLVPAITVDSPSVGQQVSSPVRVSGTANVFEGTVNVRILDANGREIARAFTTATCGSGCRGDYAVSVKYHVDHQQSGTIEVLDYSAQDGSPQDAVDIPVILLP